MQYLPKFNTIDEESIGVEYTSWVSANINSPYLYLMNKKGACVSLAGTYDNKGVLNKEVNKIAVKDIEKVVYLFFMDDYIITNKGYDREWFYRPKIAVFNIVE